MTFGNVVLATLIGYMAALIAFVSGASFLWSLGTLSLAGMLSFLLFAAVQSYRPAGT